MNNKNQETLVKSKSRVQKYGEVFTPEWLVKKMCDLLEEENSDAFSVLTRTFLEPACGNGNFLVEIFRRKLLICKTQFDGITALETIYGVDILQDNVNESRKRLRDMFADRFGEAPEDVDEILSRNIVCGNFLTKESADGTKIWFLND